MGECVVFFHSLFLVEADRNLLDNLALTSTHMKCGHIWVCSFKLLELRIAKRSFMELLLS